MSGVDPDVRWLVVAVERYLWGYARRLLTQSEGAGDVSLVIVTSLGDARNLADQQADRLRSGLYPTLVADTYAEAVGMCRAMLETVMQAAEMGLG